MTNIGKIFAPDTVSMGFQGVEGKGAKWQEGKGAKNFVDHVYQLKGSHQFPSHNPLPPLIRGTGGVRGG